MKQDKFDFENISITVYPNPDVGDNMAKITVIGVGGSTGSGSYQRYCSSWS